MARIKTFFDLVAFLLLSASYEAVLPNSTVDVRVKTAIEDDLLRNGIISVFPIVLLMTNADAWLQSQWEKLPYEERIIRQEEMTTVEMGEEELLEE